MNAKNLLTLLIAIAVTASAMSMMIPANERAKEVSQAPDHSPVIDEDWNLERVDFIHYAKPPNPGKPGKTDSCYKLMGVKWKTTSVNYTINPTNPQGLTPESVANTLSTSAETWDAATSAELFNNAYAIDYNAQYGVQDYKHSIAFGDYPDDNVIAITSVWYTPRGKQIVEFDMLLNTRYTWGDAISNPALMDLQNIATHEFGHSAGLDDIYSTTCNAVTMYGYGKEGETQKRTLKQPDKTGLQQMYGA